MSKLIDKIKIGGYSINVFETGNLITDRRSLGEWHPRTQEIHIEKDGTRQQKQESLLHEILEAIKALYDLNVEHHDLSIIATVLHQILLDNKLPYFSSDLEYILTKKYPEGVPGAFVRAKENPQGVKGAFVTIKASPPVKVIERKLSKRKKRRFF